MAKKPARQPAEPDDQGPLTTPGRFAYAGLNRVIHEKARLGIMASLAAHAEGLLFGDLKQLCSLTDGNLSRHLQVLEEAGLVEVWKGFQNRRPQTLCRLTRQGRDELLAYMSVLESVVADAAAAESVSPRKPALPGWSPA